MNDAGRGRGQAAGTWCAGGRVVVGLVALLSGAPVDALQHELLVALLRLGPALRHDKAERVRHDRAARQVQLLRSPPRRPPHQHVKGDKKARILRVQPQQRAADRKPDLAGVTLWSSGVHELQAPAAAGFAWRMHAGKRVPRWVLEACSCSSGRLWVFRGDSRGGPRKARTSALTLTLKRCCLLARRATR